MLLPEAEAQRNLQNEREKFDKTTDGLRNQLDHQKGQYEQRLKDQEAWFEKGNKDKAVPECFNKQDILAVPSQLDSPSILKAIMTVRITCCWNCVVRDVCALDGV